jgi:hypothetical protein
MRPQQIIRRIRHFYGPTPDRREYLRNDEPAHDWTSIRADAAPYLAQDADAIVADLDAAPYETTSGESGRPSYSTLRATR